MYVCMCGCNVYTEYKKHEKSLHVCTKLILLTKLTIREKKERKHKFGD